MQRGTPAPLSSSDSMTTVPYRYLDAAGRETVDPRVDLTTTTTTTNERVEKGCSSIAVKTVVDVVVFLVMAVVVMNKKRRRKLQLPT